MTTTQTAPANTLPPFCGPMSAMYRDQECPRVGTIYSLHSWQAAIDSEIERAPRVRSDWKRANILRHAEEAQIRHNRIAARMLAELPACTHAEAERCETYDVEAALPACSC